MTDKVHETSADEMTDKPGGTPPDQGLVYDPSMTDADEANLPPGSDADPNDDPPDDRDTGGGGT